MEMLESSQARYLSVNSTAEGVDVDQESAANGSKSKSKGKAVVAKMNAERIAAEMQVFNGVVADVRTKILPGEPFESRCKQVVALVSEFFGAAPTWTAFYREALGESGVARTVFPDLDGYLAFKETSQYIEVLEMLTALRAKNLPENDPTEAQRMITIRLPKSLHASICQESNDLKISVNALCISRMLQPLDQEMLPLSGRKRRGRKPGAEPAANESSGSSGDWSKELVSGSDEDSGLV